MKGLPQRDLGMAGKKAGKPVVAKKKLSAVTPTFAAKTPKKPEFDDMPGFMKGGKSAVKTPPNPFASPVSKRLKGVKI